MKFDLRDLHVYGGMILVGIGVLSFAGWGGALIALGLINFYLGTFRMGRL